MSRKEHIMPLKESENYDNSGIYNNSIKFSSLSVATAFILIIEIGGRFLLNKIFALATPFSTIEKILILRIFQITFIICITIYYKYDFEKIFGFKGPTLKKGLRTGLLWSFYFGIAAIVGAFMILYITRKNPLLFFNSPLVSNLLSSSSPNSKQFEVAIFMFTGCIVSPFAEELFFRGFIYSFFRKYGVTAALIISTSIFLLCHISGSNSINSALVIPFIGGIIFALSYEYSKSLVSPIIIHSLGNTALFTINLLLICW
ncbi:MAG: CPBP family intramembrane metalloprotease [Desulfamplus sp.]|nr:CPBP family intramembrane metalloprotease [Desulfamplus sp.]